MSKNFVSYEDSQELMGAIKKKIYLVTDAMPTASAELEGKQIQYIGSVSPYVQGAVYECQEVTPATSPKTYQWVKLYMGETNSQAIADIVNFYNSKNMVTFPFYGKSGNKSRGMTFTYGADQIVHVSGTGTETALMPFFLLTHRDKCPKLIAGEEYILSCEASTDDLLASIYFLNADGTNMGNLTVTGIMSNGQSFTESKDCVYSTRNGTYKEKSWIKFSIDQDAYAQVQVRAKTGTSVILNDETAKVMLRKAGIEDDTFITYVPTNRLLLSSENNGFLGAKNLIPDDYATEEVTVNGVTITPLGDGTYKFNGTATDFFDYRVTIWNDYDNSIYLPQGAYILSGTTTSGVSDYPSNLSPAVGIVTNDGTSRANFVFQRGDELRFVQSDTSVKYEIKITAWEGTKFNNAIFRPMLRLDSDADRTFRPYAMTNKQLTDKVRELEAALSKALIYQ